MKTNTLHAKFRALIFMYVCLGLGLAQTIVMGQTQANSQMSYRVEAKNGTTIPPTDQWGPGLCLVATFVNGSDHEISIPWGDTVYEDMFHFTITGPDGKAVTGPMNRLAPPALRSAKEFKRVAPGESVEYEIYVGGLGSNVQPWFLRKPGNYTLNAEYTTACDRYFNPTNGETIQVSNVWRGSLKSRPLTFTVSLDAPNPGGTPASQVTGQPGFAISGQVLDEQGKPLKDALIEIAIVRTNSQDGNSTFPWLESAIDRCTTDAQGRYVVDSLPDDAAFYLVRASDSFRAPVKYAVSLLPDDAAALFSARASNSLHMSDPFQVEGTMKFSTSQLPRKSEVNFVLPKGAEFRGRVVDSAGRPAYGARISNYLSGRTVYANANGFFTVTGVQLNGAPFYFWRPGLKDAEVTDAKPYQGGDVRWQIVLGPMGKEKPKMHSGPDLGALFRH